MNSMSKCLHLPLIIGFLMLTAPAVGGQISTANPGEANERHMSGDRTFREWALEPDQSENIKRIKICRVQTVCKLRFREGQTPRTRIRNLVAPLRYEEETTPVSETFTNQIRRALENLRDEHGVTIRFLGYTDNAPLSEREESIYGDHLSLSKAMAYRVAQAIQETLGLPASAIESEGRGASQPVASNDTEQGRSLNRRIEVEFWYDDPLQELPDEPQPCPGDGVQEMVTRVYKPSWGSIPALELANGQPIIPAGYAADLSRALAEIADRTNARVRFIGYTKDERLDRRTASVYEDDIGLSISAWPEGIPEAAVGSHRFTGLATSTGIKPE